MYAALMLSLTACLEQHRPHHRNDKNSRGSSEPDLAISEPARICVQFMATGQLAVTLLHASPAEHSSLAGWAPHLPSVYILFPTSGVLGAQAAFQYLFYIPYPPEWSLEVLDNALGTRNQRRRVSIASRYLKYLRFPASA